MWTYIAHRIHQLSGAQGALLPLLIRLKIIPETISAPFIAAITAHIGLNQPTLALTGTHLTPGWREAIMVKCLAQGHKCHEAGIRTNILLLTPELESGKLDRSATTLL